MTALEVVLRQVDQGYDKKSWHGTNLRGALRGVTAAQAAWRPGPGRHNIWELTLHSAYWKYTVRRRIQGGKPGGFALDGSNFLARPAAETFSEADWKRDIGILAEAHRELRTAAAALTVEGLEMGMAGKMRLLDLLLGIAAHDLYHAGQIQLLKRLQQVPGAGA